MENIHVAFASDERYFPGLLGSVCSMLISSSPNYKYSLYVLDGGISKKSWETLESSIKKINRDVHLIKLEADLKIFESFPGFYFSSVLPYGRLLLQDLIQENKVIYVDSDILFLKDISELWKINLENNSAAAALETIFNTIGQDCPNCKSLGINPESPYFNSGIMVIDLDKFRKKEILKKSIQYISDYPNSCRFWDQSALNVVLYRDYLLLDQNWNVQSHKENYHSEFLIQNLSTYNINFHFVTKAKPWLLYNNNPAYKMYYRLLNKFQYSYTTKDFRKSEKRFKQKLYFTSSLSKYYWLKSKLAKIYNKDLSDRFLKIHFFWKDMKKEQNVYTNNGQEIEYLLANWDQEIRSNLIK